MTYPKLEIFYYNDLNDMNISTTPKIASIGLTTLISCFIFFFYCQIIFIWSQVDNASSTQRKTFGLALSIILTLRLPQVLDKLDQILRYGFIFVFYTLVANEYWVTFD